MAPFLGVEVKRGSRTKEQPKKKKERCYKAIQSTPRVSRLHVLNKRTGKLKPSTDGKPYMARRYENSERVTGYFATLEEAKAWRDGRTIEANPFAPIRKQNPKPKLRKVIEDWQRRHYSPVKSGTIRQYNKLLKHHFGSLLDYNMDQLTPAVIDGWLDELKDPAGWRMKNKNRQSFEHELSLLVTILNYYNNDSDAYHHVSFGMPIVATVQFFQTHRISETAALHWEDIRFDFEHPEKSQIIAQRSIDWPREAPYSTELNWGFKNSIYLPGEK